jgi:hypothetical protein
MILSYFRWSVAARFLKLLLLIFILASLYYQGHQGLADNGDYTRSMKPFASMPADMDTNLPYDNPLQLARRFWRNWIPYWKLDMQSEWINSSTVFLWYPGVILNILFFSGKTLSATSLSLAPKTLLIGTFFLMFRWLDAEAPRRRAWFYLVLAAPCCLMLGCCDYLDYLNTFYQETGIIVFSLLFITALILCKRHPGSWRFFALGLLLLFLLSTAKRSASYLPVMGIPALILCHGWPLSWKQIYVRYIRWGIAVSVVLTVISFKMTFTPGIMNQYNSLFYGVLTFSENSRQRLEELGLGHMNDMVGINGSAPEAGRLRDDNPDIWTFENTLRVIAKEPFIVFREFHFAAENMNNITLDYLGRFAEMDPRDLEYKKRIEDGIVQGGVIQLWDLPHFWSSFKLSFFPKGKLFHLAWLSYLAIFITGFRFKGIAQELSIIGIIAVAISLSSMTVAILGDGRYELTKHLFTANIFFDIATIAWGNVVLLLTARLITRKLPANNNRLKPAGPPRRICHRRQFTRRPNLDVVPSLPALVHMDAALTSYSTSHDYHEPAYLSSRFPHRSMRTGNY